MLKYFINWNKYKPGILKEFDEFTDKLNNNNTCKFIDFNSAFDIKNFIKQNMDETISMIFPMTGRIHIVSKINLAMQDMIECLKYIDTIQNTKITFFFIPCDVFYCNINEIFFKTLHPLQSNKIKIIITMLDAEDYDENTTTEICPFHKIKGKLHPLKYPKDAFYFPMNYAYKNSFIPFNNNPVNKIALSGSIELNNNPYYTREIINKKLSSFPNKYQRIAGHRLERNPEHGNSFNLKLNKYIANIYTTVYNYNKSVILLKFFEILASGSLLIIPLEQKSICDKLGLHNNIHYKIINFENDNDMHNEINYILEPANRTEIDKIRQDGQQFCSHHLDVNFLYEHFMKCFLDT